MSADQKLWNEIEEMFPSPTTNIYKRKHMLHIDFEWTPKFCWFLLPSIEINTSVREVAINWLCLGIYIGWKNF